MKLVKLGANVIAVSRTEKHLRKLKKEVEELGKGIIIVCLDLSNWTETRSKLRFLCAKVDYLVNNAGRGYGKWIEDILEDEVDKVLELNLKSPLNLISLVAEGMKQRRFGAIVNVSSVSGLVALDQHTVYGASKAGLDLATKVTAKELAPFNVRVNSVNPTVVWTKMGKKFWDEPTRKAVMLSKIPMNRFVEVREVVDPIIFLLGKGASMITGVTLPIDGGLSAS